MSREVFLAAARVHVGRALGSFSWAVITHPVKYGSEAVASTLIAEQEADLALAWLLLADHEGETEPRPEAPRVREPTYEELRDELAKATAEIRRLRNIDDPDFTADDYVCKVCGEGLDVSCAGCGASGPDVIHMLRSRLRDAKSVASLAITSLECINPTDPSGLVKDLQDRLDAIK